MTTSLRCPETACRRSPDFPGACPQNRHPEVPAPRGAVLLVGAIAWWGVESREYSNSSLPTYLLAHWARDRKSASACRLFSLPSATTSGRRPAAVLTAVIANPR